MKIIRRTVKVKGVGHPFLNSGTFIFYFNSLAAAGFLISMSSTIYPIVTSHPIFSPFHEAKKEMRIE